MAPSPLCAALSLQPLSLDFVLDVLAQSARGLRHLHIHGIDHRDFRADNVLVMHVKPLCVKVADFGLAHARTGGPGGADRATMTATVNGPIGKSTT